MMKSKNYALATLSERPQKSFVLRVGTLSLLPTSLPLALVLLRALPSPLLLVLPPLALLLPPPLALLVLVLLGPLVLGLGLVKLGKGLALLA